MNLGIWGPSNGLLWAVNSVTMKSPNLANWNSWSIHLHCRFHWISQGSIPVGAVVGRPELPLFDSFLFNSPHYNQAPWMASNFGLRLSILNAFDPLVAFWLTSTAAGSWDPILGRQFETIWCETDPAVDTFTDGEIVLALWSDIDLTPIFPCEFRLEWVDCPGMHPNLGGGRKPPIPGEGRTIDFPSP